MTQDIREIFDRWLKEGGLGLVIEQQDGQTGAWFADENEFIPFDDLAYNSDLGFYKKSLHGDSNA